jgi:hypothetical protein
MLEHLDNAYAISVQNFEDYLKYYHELKVNKEKPLTATTTVWAFGLMEKMVLYLKDLANPKTGLNLLSKLVPGRWQAVD